MPYMIIDGHKVEYDKEKNILAVIRKAGIELPTFCYNSELSIYGACRMCVVEDEKGGIMASCSTPPKDGMSIWTNTSRLQKHRRMILELLLASHCNECTSCQENGKCKLQELAMKFGIKRIRFKDTRPVQPVDDSAKGIVRDPNKCILCGDCVRMCSEIQGIGAIDFAHRGSKVVVTPAFNKPLAMSNCVNCGQCAAVCPTGALIIKNETNECWSMLQNPNERVIAQIAPAVRIALGEEFGLRPGKNTLGKLIAALKRIGFDEVYDTSLAGDLTVMEESKEFLDRMENNGVLPLFTSCCPAWVQFAEKLYPEVLPNISTCRSPMSMFSPTLRKYFKDRGGDTRPIRIVAIMPCTAKKYEAAREEFRRENGLQETDLVITTRELAKMIKRAGVVFEELEDEAADMPFGLSSGAGMIFGVTGGVTEAVLRRCSEIRNGDTLKGIEFSGVRGAKNRKEAVTTIAGKQVKVAVIYGLNEAAKVIGELKADPHKYDFIEVMACPEGCIGGGGQPISKHSDREGRAKGLYRVDQQQQIKYSDENPVISTIYASLEPSERHKYLHVDYKSKLNK